MIGIYKITNKLNGKSYIGQSIHCDKRYKEHCRGKNQFIDETIQLEGEENFEFKLLEECKKEQLNEREDYYIRKYNTMFPNGYNKRWNTSNIMATHQKQQNTEKYYIYQYNALGEIEVISEEIMSVFEWSGNFSRYMKQGQEKSANQGLKIVQQYRSSYFPEKVFFTFDFKNYKNNKDANFSSKEYGYYQNFLLQNYLINKYYSQNKMSFNTYPFLVQPQYIEIRTLDSKKDGIKKQITMFRKLKDRNIINQVEFYDNNNLLLNLPNIVRVEDVKNVKYIRVF